MFMCWGKEYEEFLRKVRASLIGFRPCEMAISRSRSGGRSMAQDRLSSPVGLVAWRGYGRGRCEIAPQRRLSARIATPQRRGGLLRREPSRRAIPGETSLPPMIRFNSSIGSGGVVMLGGASGGETSAVLPLSLSASARSQVPIGMIRPSRVVVNIEQTGRRPSDNMVSAGAPPYPWAAP